MAALELIVSAVVRSLFWLALVLAVINYVVAWKKRKPNA